MKLLKRFIPYIRPLHHFLPEYMIYILLGIVFGLLNFALLIPMLNILFDQQGELPVTTMPEFSPDTRYVQDMFSYLLYYLTTTKSKMYALVFVCVVLVICSLLSNFFKYMSARVMMRLRFNLLEKLRNRLFDKLMNQSMSFYSKNRKGELISVMTNEIQEVEVSLVNSIQIWLRDPLVIIAYFGLLFYISPQLTLFTILFFPFSGVLISIITKRLKKVGWYSQDLMGKILSKTEESLGGVKVIQSFDNVPYAQGSFGDIVRRFSRNSRKMFRIRELASPLSEVMGVTVVAVLVIYGGQLVLNGGGLTGPQFIAYLGIYSQILPPLKNISNTTTAVQRGLVAAEKLFSVLEAPVDITEKPDALPKKDFNTGISIRNLSFRYETRDVLKNINLEVPKGKTIALVGESGSGKSTLADLVPRFYDPAEGAVLLDGIDVRDLRLSDLRNLIAIVTQEAVLFNDTVFNNIAFGCPDADPEKVRAAARMANAHSFIEQMEQGYDTVVGDRGMKLSGGQRQRLTIARAIFKDAPILILDEATSALDTESERLVQHAINELMKNRTSIVIAHRLSTIRHADEIVVMHQGEIVERGSHDQLMEMENGYYRKLVEMQELK